MIKPTFIDGIAMHQAHPETFYIPTDEAKAAVAPGSLVKAGFIMDGYSTERMWLIVTDVAKDGSITGTLDNDPVKMPLTCGDVFTVRPENLLSVYNDPDHG